MIVDEVKEEDIPEQGTDEEDEEGGRRRVGNITGERGV